VRRSIPFLVLLLATTSCGRGPDRSGSDPSSGSAPSDQMSNATAESSADFAPPPGIAAPGQANRHAGPNVGPTAAPGVAFNYRYAFRLAAPRIAEVQERHALMCEQLTVARCRITGMHYRVVNDRDIEAMLAFKLDPAAARHFGREAIGVVVQHEGMLTESEISGVDVGTSIRAAGRGIAELEADLARIEARLRQGVPAGERSQLTYDAEQLRAQIRSIRASRDQQQESLATTPMVFRYGSGDLVPGFAPRPTLRQALDNAGEGFLDGAYVLLRILIALLPWALTLGLIAWIVALIRRRWFRKAPAAAPEPEASAG
jgi:hypothetical protein